MQIIGVTGGIGSGKSTVSRVLELYNIPVFYADNQAKLLYTLPQVKQQIFLKFGHVVFENNEVNKAALAKVVFSNTNALAQLNQIIHPAVGKLFNNWLKQQKCSLVAKEAAILFESGANSQVHHTIYVYAPKYVRISRVAKRDGASVTQIKQRMANQWPAHKIKPMANYVVKNYNQFALLPQIDKILKNLKP